MKIAIASDHAGVEYKKQLVEYLEEKGKEIIDLGPHSEDRVDYPDFAHPVAVDVARGTATKGIVMCGSGNGVSMSVNKHAGIRAALCWNKEIAVLARQHNDANIIALGERTMGTATALNCVDIFLDTGFEGGRHQRRVDKLTNL